MDDNEFLNKWRARAKNIQDSHYDTAGALKRLHDLTGLPLVILSAISASNILAEAGIFSFFQPYSKLTAAFISLLVTILAAIQTFLGFEKRSDLHYKAGVKYGAIKREIERMQLVNPNPDKGELSDLETRWNALTDESPMIPIRRWKKRKDSSRGPTHAGGVVIRREGSTIQYLIVQAKEDPHEWVLPKGHIEKDESREQAARREVLEETGVNATVREVLDTVEFSTRKGLVKVVFFLMESVSEGPSPERRARKWLSFEECIQALRHKEAQRVVALAHALLWRAAS